MCPPFQSKTANQFTVTSVCRSQDAHMDAFPQNIFFLLLSRNVLVYKLILKLRRKKRIKKEGEKAASAIICSNIQLSRKA